MLTRIEIDGFKTFESFELDLDPFMVILGANAAGKSNLFDALRLLSSLAETDLKSAVLQLRGEPHELFRLTSTSGSRRMRFAAELLLDPTATDPWGAKVTIDYSRLRYEVVIELRPDSIGIDRLFVTHESATSIKATEDRWRPYGAPPPQQFRKVHMRYGRREPLLSTVVGESGRSIYKIHQDGRAGRERPADAAETTVLSGIASTEFRHLYAIREELRSWRFLQLDPAALRRPSSATASYELEPTGANLATVLARLQRETKTDANPDGILPTISADLASLIPGVIGISVVEDEKNRDYRVDIAMRDSPPLSSRVASDGTLRTLALLTLLHDPKHRGLVLFEEPENGIHPQRLRSMIHRLRDLVAPLSQTSADTQGTLSQLVMNSHSPVVLSTLADGGAYFADTVSVLNPQSASRSTRTRIRPVMMKDQTTMFGDSSRVVTKFEVEHFLSHALPETAPNQE
jgi:predicted ATPase